MVGLFECSAYVCGDFDFFHGDDAAYGLRLRVLLHREKKAYAEGYDARKKYSFDILLVHGFSFRHVSTNIIRLWYQWNYAFSSDFQLFFKLYQYNIGFSLEISFCGIKKEQTA
jgi:hypothetical protein